MVFPGRTQEPTNFPPLCRAHRILLPYAKPTSNRPQMALPVRRNPLRKPVSIIFKWGLALERSIAYSTSSQADMAQLVEHNLAKVGVAGSSPVVRSIECAGADFNRPFAYTAKWPSGKAEACKAFTPGSNPGAASIAVSTGVPWGRPFCIGAAICPYPTNLIRRTCVPGASARRRTSTLSTSMRMSLMPRPRSRLSAGSSPSAIS